VEVSFSFTVDAARLTSAGATLLTVTSILAVLLGAESESATCTLTVELAGPSGKLHWKLPPVAEVAKEPATNAPPLPQAEVVTVNVSAPGSLTVKL
jgi:multisubunit Na+/H+ antiporter MnhC subunit